MSERSCNCHHLAFFQFSWGAIQKCINIYYCICESVVKQKQKHFTKILVYIIDCKLTIENIYFFLFQCNSDILNLEIKTAKIIMISIMINPVDCVFFIGEGYLTECPAMCSEFSSYFMVAGNKCSFYSSTGWYLQCVSKMRTVEWNESVCCLGMKACLLCGEMVLRKIYLKQFLCRPKRCSLYQCFGCASVGQSERGGTRLHNVFINNVSEK